MPVSHKAILLAVLLNVSLVCRCQSPATNQVSQPAFSIALTALHDVVKTREEIRVRAVVTNISKNEIALGRSSDDRGEFEFTIEIHDSQGKTPSLTEYGKTLKGEGEVPLILPYGGDSHLHPGESFRSEIVVTKIYDLKQPDDYTVQLQRKDIPSEKIVKSNSITVTVTP